MDRSNISRRSFIRMLAGTVAFVPAARSLVALPLDLDRHPRALSKKQLAEELKTRIAKGRVLALDGESIWIRDRHVDKLRLVITDETLVWKGKHNKGKNFALYPHTIEPGDDVIALGRRSGTDFTVEKMYANIVNVYVTVDEISLGEEEAVITYTDASVKKGTVEHRGTVRVRPDYLADSKAYRELVDKLLQLRGTKVQIIGLPLKDGTVVASNVLV